MNDFLTYEVPCILEDGHLTRGHSHAPEHMYIGIYILQIKYREGGMRFCKPSSAGTLHTTNQTMSIKLMLHVQWDSRQGWTAIQTLNQ